jgi:hypothetical protein
MTSKRKSIGLWVWVLGLLGSILLENGFGGTISCGTWGLDCLVYALRFACLTQSVAAIFLLISLADFPQGTAGKTLRLVGFVASGLVSIATAVILFVIFNH